MRPRLPNRLLCACFNTAYILILFSNVLYFYSSNIPVVIAFGKRFHNRLSLTLSRCSNCSSRA